MHQGADHQAKHYIHLSLTLLVDSVHAEALTSECVPELDSTVDCLSCTTHPSLVSTASPWQWHLDTQDSQTPLSLYEVLTECLSVAGLVEGISPDTPTPVSGRE